MKLLPRTLAGQLLALLLLALIVAHLVAVLVLTWLRHDSDEVHPLSAHTIETRVSSAYRAIDSSPESAQRLVQSISLPDSQFRIRPQPFDDGQPMSEQEGKITASLQQRLGLEANPGAANPPVRVHLRMRSPLAASQAGDVDQDILGLLSPAFDEDGSWMLHVDVRLPDGQWLSSWHLPTMLLSHWSRVLSFSIPVGVLPIIVIAVLFGRRIMQPLRMLTDAAQRISRGERSAHLPLSGPEGVREIIDAFNEMQDRLLGVVNDRTRMVAAIGHDLRTPLTSLRIRAELVDDEELRQAMVTTINEMHSMVEEILHFAQDDAMRETTQHVALDALVGEVVEQQRSLGRQVDWSPPPPISYRCRPAHLKRALANLIDNAARYGRVQVRLTVPDAADPGTAGTVRMEIEDQGPGIAPQDMEQAFRPFSRLEVARNGETGGFGLGLAIARSCVRAHGGELKLHNRSEGGLRAVIELPA